MKNILVLLAAILPPFHASAFEIGHDLCKINGDVVAFERVLTNGSQFIIKGIARIDADAFLSYHYNPFYEIGGNVSLITKDNSGVVLLTWDNGFSSPILQGTISYKGNLIECLLH